jgi:hypothetical protein
MIKYTIQNNYRFIELIDVNTGDIISINKETVREVYTTPDDPYLFLIHLDDTGDHRFRYDEIEDPDTPGQPFTSLEIFRDFMVESINDISAADVIPLGTWDPNTNTPALGNGALYDSTGDSTPDTQATANQYYLVGEDGTFALDGNSTWVAGDYVRSNGTVWIRIEYSTTIHSSTVVYEATTVDLALDDIYSKLFIEHLGDTDLTGLADGNILIYNSTSGNWEPGTSPGSAGRTVLHTEGFISADAAEPTVDGLYVLGSGVPAAWVPVGAVENDILERAAALWSIHTAVAGVVDGEYEIDFENPTDYTVNYVWNGTKWVSYNAYEPDESLEDVTQTTNIGDLTGYTGGQLRHKSISWILDTMLFTVVYNPPIAPTLLINGPDGDYERGIDISGIVPITFTQNGGGSATSYEIDAIENEIVQATESGAGAPASVNLDNINGHNLLMPGITNQTAKVTVTVDYADGPIPEDNQGTQHPGDQILAGDVSDTVIYTSRYPIWWGVTSERFKVATGPESTTKPFVAPNDGSNAGGLTLDEAWIRANLNTQLFTSNLNDKVDSLQVGTVHALVVCPPGITLTTAEIFAAGSWISWDDFETHSFTLNINDAGSSNPKTYTVYYVRSTAADNFSAIQNFRFTTSGTVTP